MYKDEMTFGAEMMTALVKFQNECPKIEKSKQGYGYKYAELSTILEKIRPYLAKNNLAFTQHLIGSDILRTIVFHAPSAQFMSTDTEIPKAGELKGMNVYQTDGAKFTYYKRYAICSMLGIVTDDEDTDMRGPIKQTENKPEQKKKLNEKQFISVLSAVTSGQYSVTEIRERFDLTADQIKTLDTI